MSWECDVCLLLKPGVFINRFTYIHNQNQTEKIGDPFFKHQLTKTRYECQEDFIVGSLS